MKKAIIIFSGGMDSTTCLALAKSEGYDCHALSFNYQQKHSAELNAAKKIAAHYQVPHTIFDLPMIRKSALTEAHLQIPAYSSTTEMPTTYVPARNTIFLSHTLALAEAENARDIFIGVSAVDYSGYPDCRPEYIEAFQRMANLATKVGIEENNIRIRTPLIKLSKAETIQLGLRLGVDYQMTVTCYQATAAGYACGTCPSCVLRKKGFLEAGIADVTLYASHH